MKLGEEYRYHREKEVCYEQEGERYTFSISGHSGGTVEINLPAQKRKVTKIKNTPLKKGTKIEVFDWAFKSQNKTVIVVDIQVYYNVVKVICDKGEFTFDGLKEPYFKWQKDTNTWVKENIFRIKHTEYYYDTHN